MVLLVKLCDELDQNLSLFRRDLIKCVMLSHTDVKTFISMANMIFVIHDDGLI